MLRGLLTGRRLIFQGKQHIIDAQDPQWYVCRYVRMYVCIEVALRGLPMKRGVQQGVGMGPQGVKCPHWDIGPA